jgi:hypothetical protein
MALSLAVLVGLLLGLACSGRISRVGSLRLRGIWLIGAAFAIQVVAFPFAFLPWSTSDAAAKWLWLGSYLLLLLAGILNWRLRGVPLLLVGMAANVSAIVANGGHMPVLPGAMRSAGNDYSLSQNSVALAHPHLSWLVDRWAIPDWLPLANAFSVGDIVIAVGTALLVFTATGASLPRVQGVRLPRATGR